MSRWCVQFFSSVYQDIRQNRLVMESKTKNNFYMWCPWDIARQGLHLRPPPLSNSSKIFDTGEGFCHSILFEATNWSGWYNAKKDVHLLAKMQYIFFIGRYPKIILICNVKKVCLYLVFKIKLTVIQGTLSCNTILNINLRIESL